MRRPCPTAPRPKSCDATGQATARETPDRSRLTPELSRAACGVGLDEWLGGAPAEPDLPAPPVAPTLPEARPTAERPADACPGTHEPPTQRSRSQRARHVTE